MNRVYIVSSLLVSCLIGYLYRQDFSLVKNSSFRTTSLSIKTWWYLGAGIFFLLASWNIPFGTHLLTEQGRWVDIMIMLDVSQSMLVQDMSNNLSRLNVSKEIVTALLKKEPQASWWIGIFAWEAQGILPLTHDINLVSTFLAWVDHQNLTKQWTSLAEAITLGAERFNTETTWWNILLIISDGGEESVTIPESTKKTLTDREIYVVLVGVWSSEWWPIIEWVDIFGNALVKQRQWAPVISKLQESQLKEAASQLQGRYIRVWPSIIDQLHREIQSIPAKEQPGITNTQTKTLTSLFVFLWLISLLITLGADQFVVIIKKYFF